MGGGRGSSFVKSAKTSVSAAILYPVVCISDGMDKAGMRHKNIKYVTSQSCLLLNGKERKDTAAS